MKSLLTIVLTLMIVHKACSATYTVTVLTDNGGVNPAPGAGTGTLRQAIVDANANGGADIIDFNLGAGGPFTIALDAALPNITDNSGVTINGWENGANDGIENTIPVFDATIATPLNPTYKIIISNGATIPTGLILASDNNVIKGLVFNNFGDGTPSINDIIITITGNSNQVLGCSIGMDYLGTSSVAANIWKGIEITGSSNMIGDGTPSGANLISGTNGGCCTSPTAGIIISGGTGNMVKGNMIGLQIDGATIVATSIQGWGINISGGSGHIIGGTNSGEGNVISGNGNRGIEVGSNSNIIYGNIIGPRADGLTWVTSNAQSIGITVYANSNIIGGASTGMRNIISANTNTGITLAFSSANGNSIKGNYLGLNKTGTGIITSSTQTSGILVNYSNPGPYSNTIGGTGAGEGNVISGNTSAGINMHSKATGGGNMVYGNIIGLLPDGITPVPSNPQQYGINCGSVSSTNAIIGCPGGRNVISGNEAAGIYFSGSATGTGTVIKSNYIGLDINGTSLISGNPQDYGIHISVTAGVTIGGTGAGEGNVISGNASYGIYKLQTGTVSIYGNIIGLQADGISYVTSHSQSRGISIAGTNVTVGGSTSGHRNVISGNTTYGIYAGSTCTIKGNYIGTDISGTSFITSSTQDYGIWLASGSCAVGGAASGEGNLISGNISMGIYCGSSSNTFYGNIIGPQADGNTYLGGTDTQDYGIQISAGASNVVGGNTADHRNIISANEQYGIYLTGTGASNVIKGNYIGLGSDGISFITGSSQTWGIFFNSLSVGNTVGGTGAGDGNLISGNTDTGVSLNNTSAGGNTVIGNIIGPRKDGSTGVTSNSQDYGVYINNSPSNVIGGNSLAHRNIISGNINSGIYVLAAGSTNNLIKGNYIGTDSSGTQFISSATQTNGINLISFSTGNTVGGTGALEGNIISGNATNGIASSSSTGTNYFYQNIIGPQKDGITFLSGSDQDYGIQLSASANNIIGGNSSSHRNIISGNDDYGIYISNSAGNIIKGNYIGPGTSGGDFILGTSNEVEKTNSEMGTSNQGYGIYLTTSTTNTTIGDVAAGEGNLIAYNKVNGIYVTDISSIGNKISGNLIHNNVGKSVILVSGANAGIIAPNIDDSSPDLIEGTAAPGEIIEIYKNTTGDAFNAETYIGTTTTDGSGVWSLAVSLNSSDYVIAIARDASNNTSEFSSPVLLPIELSDFKTNCASDKVNVTWKTISEKNNAYFTIWRSPDGKKFEEIGRKRAAGNSNEFVFYSFIDKNPLKEAAFYRLTQTDFDGAETTTHIISTECLEESGKNINYYPNPSQGTFYLEGLKSRDQISVTNSIGQVIFSNVIEEEGLFQLNLTNQPKGLYHISFVAEEQVVSEVLVLE